MKEAKLYFTAFTVEKNYLVLGRVFKKALDRSSKGKGKERHSDNEPFPKQDICNELKILKSITPALFQIRKKAKEVVRLSDDKAKMELLDIINYAAGAYIVLDEKDKDKNGKMS